MYAYVQLIDSSAPKLLVYPSTNFPTDQHLINTTREGFPLKAF